MNYRVTSLENGLRVVTVPMPGTYSVAVSIFVDVGSRDERPDEAGSAHLIEHMLFKGTERRPNAGLVSEVIERVGGLLNAGTDKDSTVFYAKVGRDHASVAADLLADMLLNSLFEPAELVKEQRVVIEELGMSMDTPQDWVHSLIDEQSWPGTALGRDIAGTRESVAGLTLEGVLDFMRASYTPATTVVSIAGGIDHDAAVEIVARHWSGWQGSPAAARRSARQEIAYLAAEPSVRYEYRDTEQVNLCLAVRGVSRHDPDRYAFDLLTSVLGGSMTSRLFMEVRERRGLAYDIHSYSNKLAETGSMVTYLAVDPSNCREVVVEVLRQLKRLRSEGVPEDELRKTKDYHKGRLLLGLEDTQSVAGWCGGQLQAYGEILQPETVCERIEAVTSADLLRLAADSFRDEYLRLAALGPRSAADGLPEALRFQDG